MTLPWFPGEQIPTLIAETGLQLVDFETGAMVPWVPTRAQCRIWSAQDEHRLVYVAKPRRIMASTAFDLADVLFTVVCDAAGHRVRTGVFLDVEGQDSIKIRERVWPMTSFLKQLGVQFEESVHRIILPGGSEIAVTTAGGERAAASTGLQRVRFEEFSYYRDPKAVASILGAAAKDAQVSICTTVDITADNGKQARHYWREDPLWAPGRLFFSVEDHPHYRADPMAITEAQWKMAQEEGFTDRSAAAYWLTELLSKCGGDLAVCMHEFPQVERHMFAAGTGRYVRGTPKVAPVLKQVPTIGVNGQEWRFNVYGEEVR